MFLSNRKYSIERRTVSTNIPYFVKDNFHSEYQGSLGRLEATVEDEFKTNLRYACNRERNYSKWQWHYPVHSTFLILFVLIFCRGIDADEGTQLWGTRNVSKSAIDRDAFMCSVRKFQTRWTHLDSVEWNRYERTLSAILYSSILQHWFYTIVERQLYTQDTLLYIEHQSVDNFTSTYIRRWANFPISNYHFYCYYYYWCNISTNIMHILFCLGFFSPELSIRLWEVNCWERRTKGMKLKRRNSTNIIYWFIEIILLIITQKEQ